MTQLSQEARDLLAELNKVTDGVKNIADEARAAALKNTDISAAAKKAADDALTQQGELRAALTELSQHVAAMPTGPAPTMTTSNSMYSRSTGYLLLKAQQFFF